MSKKRNLILALVGIFFIFLMVELAGIEEIMEVLEEADPLLFVAAFTCEIVSLFFWAGRWKVLLRPFGNVSLKNCLLGILIGVFFNNITPMARAGGEPFRAYFMQEKAKVEFEDAFATVTVDHVLDAFPFVFIISAVLVYFLLIAQTSAQMITIICGSFFFNMALLILALYFSLNLKAARNLVSAFFALVKVFTSALEKYRDRVDSAVEQYVKAMKTLSTRRKDLATSLAISFVFWFFLILRNYLVVISLGIEVDFAVIVVVQVVGTLAGMLPLLPGGLGSVEGTAVFLYLSFGFLPAEAVLASLADRLISFWMTTAVGFVFVLLEEEYLRIDK